MPWEFDGPNKNPLREDTKRNIQKRELQQNGPIADEETVNLELGKHSFLLSPLETMLAVGVLSEVLQHLEVFIAQLPPSEAKFKFDDIRKRSQQKIRYEVKMTQEDYSLERKLSADLTLMRKVLYMTKDQLSKSDGTASLHCYNVICVSLKEKEEQVKKSYSNACEAVASVRSNEQKLTDLIKGAVTGMVSKIAKFEAGYEEACSNYTILREYGTKYQNARMAQNSYKIKIVEKKHKKELYNRLKAIEDEHKANKLIIKFVKMDTEKLEEQLRFWSEKYDRDIEDIDLKIAKANQEIPDLVQDLASLLSKFYKMELEMAEYIRLRNWRHKLEDIEHFLEFFAVYIQAWWRGTMVRWEIGPYAPRKAKKRPQS